MVVLVICHQLSPNTVPFVIYSSYGSLLFFCILALMIDIWRFLMEFSPEPREVVHTTRSFLL